MYLEETRRLTFERYFSRISRQYTEGFFFNTSICWWKLRKEKIWFLFWWNTAVFKIWFTPKNAMKIRFPILRYFSPFENTIMAAVRFPQWTKAIFLRQNKLIMFFFLFLYVMMSFISAVFFFSLLPVSDKSKQTFLYFSASCNLFFFFFFLYRVAAKLNLYTNCE